MDSLEDLRALISFLPDLSGKSVLELGAVENFLKIFQEQNVSNLVVVDQNEANFERLRQDASNKNVQFLNTQFNKLNLNDQKFDFIVLNSVFEKLSNDDVLVLMENSFRLLNESGYLFFRESNLNRNPITFIDMAQSVVVEDQGFDLVFAKPNSSFSSDAKNVDKVSFLFTKIKNQNHHGFKTLKEFMDHKQYSRNGVLRYERIFGAGFVSTGGVDTTLPFLETLNLQPNQKVLDVGCGIGGGDFLMAEKYGVEVLGIDLSSNMVGIALERARDHQNLKTHFEIGDITKQKFPNDYFDLIYSRDTLLHIADKTSLFANFYRWLKPGGKIFITDYCCGPQSEWSKEYAQYVEQRGYNLLTVPDYGDIFSKVGFKNVKAVDKTDLFVESLKNELVKMEQIKADFVKDFSLEDFNYLVEGWEAKLVRTSDGHQKWGLFYCDK